MKIRLLSGFLAFALLLTLSCNWSKKEATMENATIRLAVVGQSLIKVDPRKYWKNPLDTIKPILKSADVCFTNFEMAVDDGNCGVSADYSVVTGEPELGDDRPGNVSRPHAVKAEVMGFLSSVGFHLMSLANNHAWDLGNCGVRATIAAADAYEVMHAGTGNSVEETLSSAYLKVKGHTIALIAATTSRDERDLLLGTVNGVWTGHQDDWDRNIAAVQGAAKNADFVIYYHHFQIDDDEANGKSIYGHKAVGMTANEWQYDFARAVIDAGASMYIAHGNRGFDGIEIYRGRPLLRQFGGFCYQGRSVEIGHYDDDFAWWGLLAMMTINNGYICSIEFIPLKLDEGAEYIADYKKEDFLARRGLPEVATGILAVNILQRFVDLSKNYSVAVRIEGERAFLDLPKK